MYSSGQPRSLMAELIPMLYSEDLKAAIGIYKPDRTSKFSNVCLSVAASAGSSSSLVNEKTSRCSASFLYAHGTSDTGRRVPMGYGETPAASALWATSHNVFPGRSRSKDIRSIWKNSKTSFKTFRISSSTRSGGRATNLPERSARNFSNSRRFSGMDRSVKRTSSSVFTQDIFTYAYRCDTGHKTHRIIPSARSRICPPFTDLQTT